MENTNSSMKKYLLGALTIFVLFFVWRYVSNPLVVTVTGTGKVSVPATSARFTVSVIATSDSVDSAVTDLNAKISSLRLAMVNGNVNEKNISQSQTQITPLSAVVSGAKGYSATAVIYGQTNDVLKITDLVVSLYNAGASVVSQPVIEVSNQQELENTALKSAMNEASTNARYLAKIKRKLFKKVVSIQQASSGNVATATKTEASDKGATSSFEVAKAVSVVYWMW